MLKLGVWNSLSIFSFKTVVSKWWLSEAMEPNPTKSVENLRYLKWKKTRPQNSKGVLEKPHISQRRASEFLFSKVCGCVLPWEHCRWKRTLVRCLPCSKAESILWAVSRWPHSAVSQSPPSTFQSRTSWWPPADTAEPFSSTVLWAHSCCCAHLEWWGWVTWTDLTHKSGSWKTIGWNASVSLHGASKDRLLTVMLG